MTVGFLDTAVSLETFSEDSLSSTSDTGSSSPATSILCSPILDKASLPTPSQPPSAIEQEKNGPGLPDSLPLLPDNETPVAVAEPDRETPDNWIKRNPELIRLTGKHPLNAEAQLGALFGAGFLTPSHLHFVRNHGAVPQVTPEILDNWTIRVHGLVARETTFTLQALCDKFPVVTLPVTLVCAGNRRKEQNVVRKSLGFSWGAAGLSTALWTGVYLSDVLEYVKPLRGQAKHVVFEGSDDSLPNGPYGTSQRLSWAVNREKGMLIAWAMNGQPLEPDHGFPVRVIIPGQIGGRSVKWLKRIEISSQESQHYLHFWDNRVLPAQLMPDQARSETQWWYDPKYLITELNVNSVIAKPDHNERLTIDNHYAQAPSYTLRGYAYAGGGRRVTRVEVSLDEGETWTLANVEYPEDLYRAVAYTDPVYGTLDLTDRDTSFCWCFWTFDISYDVLGCCDALMVRAMDEGLALQPRDMYWHALGMMNNWWFRVAIRRSIDADKKILQFEHPAVVGPAAGGWMERMKAAGEDFAHPSFSNSAKSPNCIPQAATDEVPLKRPGVDRKITPQELQAHGRHNPWFVVDGEVYDGTSFLDEHPGGADSIMLVAGEDASEDFHAIHSAEGRAKLAEHHIGTLTAVLWKMEEMDGGLKHGSGFLERAKWNAVQLHSIQQINHDSSFYRFTLPHQGQELGLPVGQHVFIRFRRKDTGEMVQRAYTPVSRQGNNGFIDFLIKLYLPCSAFPVGGKMSTGLHQLNIGDVVEVKGPLGLFSWKGSGTAIWKGVERKVKEIGMICGGSGITPILQVLRGILNDDREEDIKIWLISANKTEGDILCKEELDSLSELHGHGRFRLHYILGTASASWAYSTGRINDALISNHMPRPSEHGMILCCGPEVVVF